MQFSGNVLIIEHDQDKRQALETIFTFLGAATQTGEIEDCLSYLDSSSEQIDACILGTLTGKVSSAKIMAKYPRTAFIVCDSEFIPSGKEDANYIGRLSNSATLALLPVFSHYEPHLGALRWTPGCLNQALSGPLGCHVRGTPLNRAGSPH